MSLKLASFYGHIEIMKLLLDRGAHIDAKNNVSAS
jgi:ankyrin repeat protein